MPSMLARGAGRRRSRPIGQLATLVAVAALALAALAAVPAGAARQRPTRRPRVLLVGSYHGRRGRYRSIQRAVDAARPGDWILVGPGDYKVQPPRRSRAGRGYGEPAPAAILIRTPDLHLRGMNRNKVIIDGTKRGYRACSGARAAQVVTKSGLNGIEVYKASGTWIENLTVCNYLTNKQGTNGNEIWWNGGQGTGRIGMHSYWGDYLTATSTYSNGVDAPYGSYGIYSDNANGPGYLAHDFASNMGDSAFYVGGCPDCNALLDHIVAVDSALGYSGTNSGGNLIIEHSLFEHNKSGITSNSQDNSDAPSPQSGACPPGRKAPLHNGICTAFRFNRVVYNDNPNVPGNSVNGLAGASPVGTGVVLAGTRMTEIYKNVIAGNDAWGVLVVDLPDQETPPPSSGEHCQGGVYVDLPTASGQAPVCWFQALGNQVLDNRFAHNGSYGNPSNGDVALVTTPSTDLAPPHHVYGADCFSGNTDPAGFSSDPPAVQSDPLLTCGKPSPGNPDPVATFEAECAAQLLASCPSGPAFSYPRASKVVLHMAPAEPTMPNPCAGVPANPWCPPPRLGHHRRHRVRAWASGETDWAAFERRLA